MLVKGIGQKEGSGDGVFLVRNYEDGLKIYNSTKARNASTCVIAGAGSVLNKFFHNNTNKTGRENSGLQIILDRDIFLRTIDNYMAERIKINRRQNDFKLLASNNSISITGNPAYRLVYIYRSRDMLQIVKRMELGIIVDMKCYCIKAGSEAESFCKYLPIYEKMISTIKFSKSK